MVSLTRNAYSACTQNREATVHSLIRLLFTGYTNQRLGSNRFWYQCILHWESGYLERVNPETETADATFLKKHVGDKYKESTAKDKGIENFTFDQVITTDGDMDYLKGGLFQLKNLKRITFRKNKRQRNK